MHTVINDQARVCVAGLIRDNEDKVLLVKQAESRGAYPGQWALPGGGVDAGETIGQALQREMREEIGVFIEASIPFIFQDDVVDKLKADGTTERVYMIYLIFDCETTGDVVLDEKELVEHAWTEKEDLQSFDLNEPTQRTMQLKGWL